jgi:2,3-bisphosphoglycerate-independent phosphoglycerate mutase
VFPDSLVQPAQTRILLCILDGLGDIPGPGKTQTPLEAARTPNLDRLAGLGTTGLFDPVAAGVTPGSGPGHLALFGYNPAEYQVGRGVLSALGVDFDLQPGDVAARFNFCSLDDAGLITDRRAGRIATEINRKLVARLREEVSPPAGVEVFWDTESEHRGLLVVRGSGLDARLSDTDPQILGKSPLTVKALAPEAGNAATLLTGIADQAFAVLKEEHPANGILLRGFASLPDWPGVGDRFGVRACAVAKYPMYRGVAKLVGMTLGEKYDRLADAPALLRAAWDDYDYFFLHFKDPDKAGEDGNFDRKVQAVEEFDAIVPDLLDLKPDVVVATGDHSTPAALAAHSWHPVPVVLYAPDTMRPDTVESFGERAVAAGGLGQRPMHELMSLMLAHAGRLAKFGA